MLAEERKKIVNCNSDGGNCTTPQKTSTIVLHLYHAPSFKDALATATVWRGQHHKSCPCQCLKTIQIECLGLQQLDPRTIRLRGKLSRNTAHAKPAARKPQFIVKVYWRH